MTSVSSCNSSVRTYHIIGNNEKFVMRKNRGNGIDRQGVHGYAAQADKAICTRQSTPKILNACTLISLLLIHAPEKHDLDLLKFPRCMNLVILKISSVMI